MKKIILALFIISSICCTISCKKQFLDRDPLSQLSQGTFWKSQGDADLALAACYNFLCKGNNATSVSAAGAGFGGAYMYWETLTDNGYTTSSAGNFGTLSLGN